MRAKGIWIVVVFGLIMLSGAPEGDRAVAAIDFQQCQHDLYDFAFKMNNLTACMIFWDHHESRCQHEFADVYNACLDAKSSCGGLYPELNQMNCSEFAPTPNS